MQVAINQIKIFAVMRALLNKMFDVLIWFPTFMVCEDDYQIEVEV